MAITVAADNDRIAVATAATDAGTWGNDGGGGGVADEPDFVYQGTSAQSRKVSTTRIGRSYSGGTTRDATATDRRHFLFKVNVTNYAGLLARTTPAAGLKIGSGGTAYDEWYVYGNDNYPLAGGWQFVVISPNVTGYIDGGAGTPDMTAVDYYSFLADFSAGSKGENLVIDAIDLGRGLKLTGNTPDGVFSDFLDHDEGTSTNRFGYVRSLNGIYFINGELAIGEDATETAVATTFTDATGKVLVWENGMAETGYHRFKLNLGNASNDVTLTGHTFDSLGELNNTAGRGYTTTEDTRLIWEVVGTAGSAVVNGCQIKNSASVTLTSVCELDACDVETADLTQSGAWLHDSTVRTTSLANVAACDDVTLGTSVSGLHDVEFIQNGTGHALEFTSAGTYDFQDLTFTGYNASDGASDSAVYCSAGSGTITINVNGTGNAPSVRAPGMTIVVVTGAVSVSVQTLTPEGVAVGSCRVFLPATATTGSLPVDDVVTIVNSGTTATVTHTAHGLATNDKVDIAGASLPANLGTFQITVTGVNSYTYTMGSTPGASPTGTITSTFVFLSGVSDAVTGILSMTRAIPANQSVLGWARNSSPPAPFYNQGPIAGTVDSAAGASLVAVMIESV